MSSISREQLNTIKVCVDKIAKSHRVVGICLYGSKAAGYARPNSDFDIIIVLEDYAYTVKYVYLRETDVQISALVVDRQAFEKDACSGFLGEFVAGRLLHIYEPITNPGLFRSLEVAYKRRVILDEIFNIVRTTNIICTEISFPLEYIMFSKIRHRSILYPNAIYSYYKIYTGQNALHNIEFALDGYQEALKEIIEEDGELLIFRSFHDILRISEKRVDIERTGKIASLKLAKKLQQFTSYFIHAYAGRHTIHYAITEAEAKIRRHNKYPIELPNFISSPKKLYWKLPEGLLIIDDEDWLYEIAKSNGFFRYFISNKSKLGGMNSTSISYTLTNSEDRNQKKVIVVKDLTKSQRGRWPSLRMWTFPGRDFRINPLYRLGIEYKALRYIRSVGLNTPVIECVVLGKKILVTQFIEGKPISDIINECLKGNASPDGLKWIKEVGEQIAKIHANKSTLGSIKPNNIILSKENTIYFTGVEEFGFKAGDPVYDVIHFISRGLKKTSNNVMARKIIKEFLRGYSNVMPIEQIKKLLESRNHVKLLYPTITPSVARTIEKELSKFIH